MRSFAYPVQFAAARPRSGSAAGLLKLPRRPQKCWVRVKLNDSARDFGISLLANACSHSQRTSLLSQK